MKRNFEDGVLERVTGVLGTPLFEFVVNADTDTLAIGSISANQKQCLREMDSLLTGQIAEQYGAEAIKELLRSQLTAPEEGRDEPLAVTWHVACGGTIVMPEAANDLEAALLDLAKDLYPSFLLPIDDQFPGFFRENIAATRAAFRHPANERFQQSVLKDKILKKVFTKHDDTSGWTTPMIFRSSFQGSGLQLWTLAEMTLRATWRDRSDEAPLSIEAFLTEAQKQWRFIYDAFAGKKQTVRARAAFTGVRLPAGGPFDFGDVQIRETTSDERSRAPESLKGGLTGTDAEGNTVMANYEGDVVAELEHPYFLSFADEPSDGQQLAPFPKEMTNNRLLEDAIERLRLSLSLAVTRPHRVQIAPSWRLIDDPLGHGSMGLGSRGRCNT